MITAGHRASKHLVWITAAASVALSAAACDRMSNLRRNLEGDRGSEATVSAKAQAAAPGRPVDLEMVAASDAMWTGVAVSRDERIFVCFPRWGQDVAVSVGEIRIGGKIWPYPNEDWNSWSPPMDPGQHFVCAQSVYVDGEDFLWVLDPANAYLRGVVPGGAKLVKIDLRKSAVIQKVLFDDAIAPAGSYLNDVRIDLRHGTAYISDSGLGAIVVVDLATGDAGRVLTESPSTKAEGAVLKIDGREWRIGGLAPQVHVDGIALDPGGDYLYYQALSGRSLYRIATASLRDASLSEQDLAARVESLGTTGAADGIEFGSDGYLYLTAIEENAVKIFASLGEARVVASSRELRWPDSLARSRDHMYVSTSQIHLGAEATEPYKIFKFRAED